MDKGESIKTVQRAFRTMGREHDYNTKNRMAFNDEFVGADKYYPKFSQVEANVAKQLTFSPNQIERQTLYFEGDPAELVQT